MKIRKLLSLAACLGLSVSLLAGCANAPSGTQTEIKTENTEKAETSEANTLETDVIVIGAGGGGLSAAIEAHDAGANVIIVEKMPFAGGNTARATGGINAAGTKFQEEAGIEDTVEVHFADTMKGGEDLNDPELVKFMTENAAPAVAWLTDLGADLSDVGSLGGASFKRAHRPTGGAPVGDHLVNVLLQNTTDRNIKTMLNTEATEVVYENDKVTGIKATETVNGEKVNYMIKADAVIIASGGFGNNPELYTKYQPQLDGFISTNQPGATGDGIVLAETLGADLTDIEQIQIHPTVHTETAALITEAVRGNGAILVNAKGERFTNEMSTRDKVSAAILEQEGKSAYLVFDQSVRESLKAIEKYVNQGLTVEGETPEALASALNMDGATLKATIDAWNQAVESGTDSAFGRSAGMDIAFTKAPYYAIPIAPGVHHTMGGIKINTDAQVINKEGNPINGLFAAGEVTGGVHGAERLGGNALADIIVFGREAGTNAATLAMSDNNFIGAATASTETDKADQPKINEEAKAQYKDGVYQGEATGNNGKIQVEVTVKDGFIDTIEVLEHHETSSIFMSIQNDLIPSIIYSQSTEGIDAVTGASNSSAAVFEAVNTALATAK